MKEDDQILTLTRGGLCSGCKVGEIMQLSPIPEDEEAMVEVEDGLGKIPVFVSSQQKLLVLFRWLHKEGARFKAQEKVQEVHEQAITVKGCPPD